MLPEPKGKPGSLSTLTQDKWHGEKDGRGGVLQLEGMQSANKEKGEVVTLLAGWWTALRHLVIHPCK